MTPIDTAEPPPGPAPAIVLRPLGWG
ncbi:MAG: hypothetical protein RLZZ341_2076, partial [Pseudomonadota bacterium]